MCRRTRVIAVPTRHSFASRRGNSQEGEEKPDYSMRRELYYSRESRQSAREPRLSPINSSTAGGTFIRPQSSRRAFKFFPYSCASGVFSCVADALLGFDFGKIFIGGILFVITVLEFVDQFSAVMKHTLIYNWLSTWKLLLIFW